MPCSVQFSKYGDTDMVRVVDVPALSPGAEQVRIAVRAAGINPIDWKTMQGLMREEFTLTLPAGLGTDVAGVVDQVGADVTEFRAGDAVMGASLTPSFAEFALADPASLIKKPAAINWEVAGSVAGAGGTAYAVLNKLGVHATDTLLIHAAAGGVGTFAVQLAVARGARVIGTASEPNFDYLRSMGAEPVAYGDGLRERVRAIAPRGVDAVLDASGRGENPLVDRPRRRPRTSTDPRRIRRRRRGHPSPYRRARKRTRSRTAPGRLSRRAGAPEGAYLAYLPAGADRSRARCQPIRPPPRQNRPPAVNRSRS
jgi:D-arabinose 1-dehydrogenase-like Zn-dependent alcohol dehydrogenase